MKNYKYISLIIVTAITLSCTKSDFDEFDAVSAGTANFTTYIAVGNSLTQGYQDGGLHNEYQQQDNSYPSIIAKQMGTSFTQPLVSGAGSGHKFLAALAASPTLTDISPDANFDLGNPLVGQIPTGWSSWNKSTTYNNLGVSGIKLRDCVAGGTGALFNVLFNPYAAFLDLGDVSTPTTYLSAVKKTNATFYTNWLGNNDVLGWSTTGGNDAQEILTPVSEFRSKYDSILAAFQLMGAKGVCATIPDVTSIPFFTTVPHNPIPLDAATAATLNGAYAAYNGALDAFVLGNLITASEAAMRKINFVEGSSNAIVIMDESLTDLTTINAAVISMRQATAEDFILLSASSDIGRVLNPADPSTIYGVAVPFADSLVLTASEIAVVKNHTNMLNVEIMNSAAAYNTPVVDMHAFMTTLVSGLNFDGVAYTAKYIEGGAFSLDGVHPNTRGYAILANKFIETINKTYGANLNPVPVQDYRGITFP